MRITIICQQIRGQIYGEPHAIEHRAKAAVLNLNLGTDSE
jgi:hypothetical protein